MSQNPHSHAAPVPTAALVTGATGRIGTPADVAQAVCYLADAPYVTGQSLVVDGGVADHMLTMIPGRPGK